MPDILQNRAHPLSADLLEVTHVLAGHMLHRAGLVPSPEAGILRSSDLLSSGAAFRAWLRIVEAQGGDPSVCLDPFSYHRAVHTRTLHASCEAFLNSTDCRQIGWAVQRLGAGRTTPGAPVSAAAGIEMHGKIGDRFAPGQPLVTLFSDDRTRLEEAVVPLQNSFVFSDAPPARRPLVHEIITAPATRK